MTLEEYMTDYSNQYPEADSILPLIYGFGEEHTKTILENRDGAEIKLITDRDRPDFLEWKYI